MSSCSLRCSFIWTGLGRWVGKEWKPFLPSDNYEFPSLMSEKKIQKTEETVLFFGDSVTKQLAKDFYGLRKAYNICDQVFKKYVQT